MATFPNKIKLLRGIISGDEAYTGPLYVTIDVTGRCNLRCLCCPYHSPRAEGAPGGEESVMDMDLTLFRSTCEDLQVMGTELIILEGDGEPMLHENIFDFIAEIKGRDLSATMFTNGTFLDEDRIKCLVDSRLDVLKVSLWAGTPDGYARNQPDGEPKVFERIIASLKKLSDVKKKAGRSLPSVELCLSLNRLNFGEVDALVELSSMTGSDSVWFSPLDTHRGRFDSFALSEDEERSLLASLVRTAGELDALSIKHNVPETILRYRLGSTPWETLPCHVGWYHTRVKADGSVFGCLSHGNPMGNLTDQDFREIWNGSLYSDFRRRTATLDGLATMVNESDCDWCSHVADNRRVIRVLRWLPLKILRSMFLHRSPRGR